MDLSDILEPIKDFTGTYDGEIVVVDSAGQSVFSDSLVSSPI